jgi:hypothetical protein
LGRVHRFINREVRPLLPQVGAYKAEDSQQARWVITEEQAREVARKLGRPFTSFRRHPGRTSLCLVGRRSSRGDVELETPSQFSPVQQRSQSQELDPCGIES